MKIYFDTNVIISAFLTKGSSFEVIENAVPNHDVYYSDYIIEEIIKILTNKIKLSKATTEEIIQFIKNNFKRGIKSDKIFELSSDKDDNYILSDCIVNKIDFFITGDKKLLEIKDCQGVKIIPPNKYWNIQLLQQSSK